MAKRQRRDLSTVAQPGGAKGTPALDQITKKINLKYKRLSLFWFSPLSKGVAEGAGQINCFK